MIGNARFSILPALVFAVLAAAPSRAAERVTAERVIADPKGLLGRPIELADARCADVRAGFLCVIVARGRTIRLEAGALGATTSNAIAEKLNGACKGEDKLSSPRCRFIVEGTITTAVAEEQARTVGEPWTYLYAPTLDLRERRSRSGQ